VLHQDSSPVIQEFLHPILLLFELCAVGLAFDWLTLRNADTLRLNMWESLVTLYRVRRPASILVTIVPLLAAVVGMYTQLKLGSGTPNVPRPPAIPPAPIGENPLGPTGGQPPTLPVPAPSPSGSTGAK